MISTVLVLVVTAFAGESAQESSQSEETGITVEISDTNPFVILHVDI